MNTNSKKIIEQLGLEPLEMEGGYFRRTYTDDVRFDFGSELGERSKASAIYYLLTPETHSKIHCLPTDEIYHFYLGDPVELLLLENEGAARKVTLHCDVLNGSHPQFVVPKDTWQGSHLKAGGSFALLGTTMAPAFEYRDFKEPGNIENFLSKYPKAFHQLIKRLS